MSTRMHIYYAIFRIKCTRLIINTVSGDLDVNIYKLQMFLIFVVEEMSPEFHNIYS